jgi:hypothetical protein
VFFLCCVFQQSMRDIGIVYRASHPTSPPPGRPSGISSAPPGAPLKSKVGYLRHEFEEYMREMWVENFSKPNTRVIDLSNQVFKQPPTNLVGHVVVVCKIETWMLSPGGCKQYLQTMFATNEGLTSAKVIVISLPHPFNTRQLNKYTWSEEKGVFVKGAIAELLPGHQPAAINRPLDGSSASTSVLVRDDLISEFYSFADFQTDFQTDDVELPFGKGDTQTYIRMTPKPDKMEKLHDLKGIDDFLMHQIARNLQRVIGIITDDKKLKKGKEPGGIVTMLVTMLLNSADIFEMNMDRTTTTKQFNFETKLETLMRVSVTLESDKSVKNLESALDAAAEDGVAGLSLEP